MIKKVCFTLLLMIPRNSFCVWYNPLTWGQNEEENALKVSSKKSEENQNPLYKKKSKTSVLSTRKMNLGKILIPETIQKLIPKENQSKKEVIPQSIDPKASKKPYSFFKKPPRKKPRKRKNVKMEALIAKTLKPERQKPSSEKSLQEKNIAELREILINSLKKQAEENTQLSEKQNNKKEDKQENSETVVNQITKKPGNTSDKDSAEESAYAFLRKLFVNPRAVEDLASALKKIAENSL